MSRNQPPNGRPNCAALLAAIARTASGVRAAIASSRAPIQVVVEPNRSLSYTWDAMGLESVVTWTLTPTGTGTMLRMEQAGFRPDQQQAYQGAKFGWQKFIANLEAVLGKAD